MTSRSVQSSPSWSVPSTESTLNFINGFQAGTLIKCQMTYILMVQVENVLCEGEAASEAKAGPGGTVAWRIQIMEESGWIWNKVVVKGAGFISGRFMEKNNRLRLPRVFSEAADMPNSALIPSAGIPSGYLRTKKNLH